jgi:cytochrome b pre-mRNA-processing protein 3
MLNVFRRNPQAPTIEALYGAIVAQARSPVFYLEYRVPDTVNGRLDMLMLHLALAFERLSHGDAATAAIGQGLFDRFCRDMDDHLREQGVSDLKVPKEMRNVGAAFFGRHGTYLNALRSGDEAALQAGLARNVYQDSSNERATEGAQEGAKAEGVQVPAVRRLAAYVKVAHAHLSGQEPLALAAARLTWPDPASIAVQAES